MVDRTTLTSRFPDLKKPKIFDDAEAAVQYIHELYNESVATLLKRLDDLSDGNPIDQDSKATYPYIGLHVTNAQMNDDPLYSHGVVSEPGTYGTTVTRPDLFHDYYVEQLQNLMKRHGIPVIVGASDVLIPLPFAVEHSAISVGQESLTHIRDGFVLPDLIRIDDDIPNSTQRINQKDIKPLSLFSGERVDFSLQRLHHYTATSPEHFQSFIILTNYQRYIDAFIDYGKECMKNDDAYTEIVGPSGFRIYANGEETPPKTHHLPQMPAYHLKRKDGQGITFVNIGVGPSNAKTITDHLSVLRPHCWLMLGHCAGLRATQVMGDYVLAHGYVREDHVLDSDLPPWIPVPAIAEMQIALRKAASDIAHINPGSLKEHLRTGTVFTTDNRNWELQSKELYIRLSQSRAIAVDMESATIAANGFRFRVPYATLLCISDKPIHGEIKLKGMANEFYKSRVTQHLLVGLEAMNILRKSGVDQLHSRKLRGFDDPPFR